MTKIEKVETFLWSRWLLIKIHSEDGFVGDWRRAASTVGNVPRRR